MNEGRDVRLVDDLISGRGETACVEFKLNNDDPEMIGKLSSALANAARAEGRNSAFVLWGVEEASHSIVGTTFTPDEKRVGNQAFELWLAQRLNPSIAFRFKAVAHPKGRVVLMEVPPATAAPVNFNGVPYIRIGSATPKLSDFPDRYQQLIAALRPHVWERGAAIQHVSSDDVLSLLDYPQYFRLTNRPLPDNRLGVLDCMAADDLIRNDVGGRFDVTNKGALLFAADLRRFDVSLARKSVRIIAYGGKSRTAQVIHRIDDSRGYAAGFEDLIRRIAGLLPRNEHIGAALREASPLFPEIALRELVANALIHQDMTIGGAGPLVELFSDRIEITNPGRPLLQVDRMIDLPPRSRNEAIADLMRRMSICEEQGSGLDKVISSVELYQSPPPLFRAEDGSMQAILYAPRSFAEMSPEERVRACYQHAVLRFLSGERMKNSTLCARFGIEPRNAAQASGVFRRALEAGLIRLADPESPRAGYVPIWA